MSRGRLLASFWWATETMPIAMIPAVTVELERPKSDLLKYFYVLNYNQISCLNSRVPIVDRD